MTDASGPSQHRSWQNVFQGAKQILIQEWHPVGAPVPDDEYDSYALTLSGMLLRNGSAVELMAYLTLAETHILGEMRADFKARSRTVANLLGLVGR